MSRLTRLPCLKPHAAHTAPRRALSGISQRQSSNIAALAAATMAIFNPLSTQTSVIERSA